MSGSALQVAIRGLAAGRSLGAAEAAEAFGCVMRGEASAAQLAALLVGLRVKGESADEVAGVARALRAAMIRLPADDPGSLVDTCGTGGGDVPTFNISTAAALVAAGAGVRVAKHGNRSFTSRSGSADVLEALGVQIETTPAVMEAALRDAGIVFMFAPLMHPAMRHVGPVRRELGIPTVMNIVGPLANPAGAGRQVVGVADERRLPLIADALAALGSEHALVVHGAPGLDEVSPLAATRVLEVRGQTTREWCIDPAELGVGPVRADELAGAEPADNAAIIEAVLAGRASTGATAAVLLNAAAAIYVSGGVNDFPRAYERARDALHSGEGARALDRLRRAFARPPEVAR
ncbi:MAG TPA: anthranilate phosphoribosyltransferase [Gemmatimonadaceae bacterium]|nr:anthranilate phosphoribosyltransferase [Gemmatimonadaceae bacterium]